MRLENILEEIKRLEFDSLCEELDGIEESYYKPKTIQRLKDIKSIYYNDEVGKESVVVIWEDGVKIVKKLAEGDSFDLNVGVALCIAERMFGSKNAFHKEIKTKAKKTNKDK